MCRLPRGPEVFREILGVGALKLSQEVDAGSSLLRQNLEPNNLQVSDFSTYRVYVDYGLV
jgi:hypothetical protein